MLALDKIELRSDLFGGARRSRTADLLNAIQALSQLSYGPNLDPNFGRRCCAASISGRG
jgi:hypothetical protein